MAYSSITKPGDYFNTVIWSGDDTSPRNITGAGFQPDLVWGKARSGIGNHWLIDSNRGTTGSLYRVLNSDDTATEQTTNSGGTTSYGIVTTIGTDGFTVADGSSGDLNVNNTGDTYVSWNWLGGGTASSNTDGSITSSVSANTTAGFSIVSYSGNGTAGATVGHGLGTAPSMIFVKDRTDAQNWAVYHASLGATKYLQLNTNDASVSSNITWNDTAPTSSVFSLGAGAGSRRVNFSGDDYVAYCFHSVKGYSKVGNFTGNGSADGTFVYTGFKPSFLFFKVQGTAAAWRIFDSKRPGYNVIDDRISPSSSSAEATEVTCDFLSNGFKIRTTDAAVNASGEMVIYYAIAEQPLVANASGGIPATAR